MAEVNARREARKRRILENSESRLRRITGRVNSVEIKDNDPQVESNGLKADSNFGEDNVRNGVCNVSSDTKLKNCTRFDNRHESFLNDISNKNIHSSEQASKSEFMSYTLLFSCVSFILLAGIVNILFVLKLDYLFGQAVIIPYLLLTMGRLYSCTTLYEAQDNSLLVIALMLCNVKPRLIHIFKISFALFTMILNDFCLYMFSFVLMRYIIIRYYYYNPAVPTNA
ncbi:hypothetical protein ALC60_04494 [Trachymyrmex zeteki]|uniref:Uncharacterized protein n=1 Tax=Mycetomoellerius zeteki TaxID=64791 RepID=A0A151X8B5_9HYME|nr:PREDICTED: uncharacterized protein LOC108721687 [Trachymyrmex zeteki]KYQ56579.1 hypothetical protein ALC60_04494 [Trachymyrmex zeteki]